MKQRISLLKEAGEFVSSNEPFNQAAKPLLRIVLNSVDSSAGALLNFDQQKNCLQVSTSIGLRRKKISLPTPKEIESQLTCPIVLLPDADGSLSEFLSYHKDEFSALKAEIWVPLSYRNELMGIISLSKKNSESPYDEEDLHFLSILGQYLSVALHNSKLQKTIKQTDFELNLKVLELETLRDISKEISSVADGAKGLSNLEVDNLMEEITVRTLGLLDASGCCLMLSDQNIPGQLRIAASFPDSELVGKSVPIEAKIWKEIALKGEPRLLNRCPKNAFLSFPAKFKKFLGVPIRSQEGISGVLCAFDKESRDGSIIDFSDSDQSLLYGFANQAGVALENARLYKEALEKRIIQADIKAAADIQSSLFPKSIPQIEGFDIDAMNQARGNNVGGDYYDFIPEGDNRWGMLIADVSGKGLQAALSMARLCAGVHAEVEHSMPLTEMVSRLNNLLKKRMPLSKYITFFYASLDLASKTITYVNAGHEFPMLLHPDGTREDLDVGGFFLGMFEPEIVSYESQQTKLRPGDILLLYTDGLTDATNLSQETFGKDRLELLLRSISHLSAKEIRERIYNEIISFEGEAPRFDDLTFVVIKAN